MHRFTTLALALLVIGCSEGNPWARSKDRDEPGGDRAALAKASVTNNPPTTTISAVQNVATDPRAIAQTKLSTAKGGPAKGKRDDKLKPAALFYGPLPTCFAFTSDDRLFVNFPRWGMITNYTVAEVKNGTLVPYPDVEANSFYPEEPGRADAKTHLVSVQSVVTDSRDRLWIVDTGSINMQPIIDPLAPKLWAYDVKSGQRVKAITFAETVKKNSYLNDVRFDLRRGTEGMAYITDSGAGGIVVVDLASGQSWRKLDDHPSVKADRNLAIMVEGEALRRRLAGKAEEPVLINSDGIALSPDGKTLYYTPLTGRAIYGVSTDYLDDRNASQDANAVVKKVAEKPSANDGLVCDAEGRLYSTDFEDNCIRRTTPADGKSEVVLQDERLLWPDCVMIHNGKLYVTSNQLHRQGDFHGGQNLLESPFVLFEYPVNAREKKDH
jgi:sugar lactone lactonase YvrE